MKRLTLFGGTFAEVVAYKARPFPMSIKHVGRYKNCCYRYQISHGKIYQGTCPSLTYSNIFLCRPINSPNHLLLAVLIKIYDSSINQMIHFDFIKRWSQCLALIMSNHHFGKLQLCKFRR